MAPVRLLLGLTALLAAALVLLAVTDWAGFAVMAAVLFFVVLGVRFLWPGG